MEWYGFILAWHERHGRAPYWQPPVLPELETNEYYPLHPHTQMLNRVKVHPQMIIENAADPYHVQYVHKAANPATTASFEVAGYHLHATVNAHFGGGREQTWLTPNGPVDAKIIYDNYSLGLGVVRFPSELVATVQVTGQTPVDEDYTDYFYTQASVREPGDGGDVPTGRAARFLGLQQEVIKQDFFTWENMKYLEKPNLAPEEAHDYAALRRWAHRFYPGEEPSPSDFGYSADGEPDPVAAKA
jgi:phenylpropionate dioxygenase-like ring-hydroxylating dioxygenase large terminal subunit